MNKLEKAQVIEQLTSVISDNNIIYLADASGLNAEATSKFRETCFKSDVKMTIVKNTLLRKAMENSGKEFENLYDVLKGSTALMISETGNAPAKVIKNFRKKSDLPILKGAFIEEAVYVGDENLDALVAIKSKEELVGDIIGLLQSPAKNVISALQSSGQKLSGIVKTLSER